MSEQRELIILNLSGEFGPELQEYFSSRKVKVVDPLSDLTDYDWTHIIVRDIHHFDQIGKTYEVLEKNRHLISLSKVNDIKNFTLNNGDIILDDVWLKGSLGSFILDKYFQGFGGIGLAENYPVFKEEGSFNIANPFSTGEYLDIMIQKAFESNVEALSVKTSFDHLVMYIAGLKAQGRVGLPFEVTYGSFDEIFAVQVHFFSEALSVTDISMSLSTKLSRQAEEYYLNLAVQSADFFDFSFMPELGKVIVTSLWTTDKRVQFENRGFMVTSLTGASPQFQYSSPEFSVPSIIGAGTMTDFTSRVVLPGKPQEESYNKMGGSDQTDQEHSQTIKRSQGDSETSQVVSGGEIEADEDQLVKGQAGATDDEDQLVKGQAGATDDEDQLVKGQAEATDDEKAILSGDKILDDVVQTVRGKFEANKDILKLSGSKLDVDKFAFNLASNINETTKEKNLKVRSLGSSLPDKIKSGLSDYAGGLSKPVEDLVDEELDDFQIEKIPEILKNELESQIRVSQIPLDSRKEDSMSLKSLSSGEGRDKSSDKLSVKSLDQPSAPQSSLATSQALKQLETRLITEKTENNKLRSQLKALNSEVRILKETRNKLAEIHMKSTKAASEVNVSANEEEDKVRKYFQRKLDEQKTLNELDLKRLSLMLEKHSKVVTEQRELEAKARKLEHEVCQKETLFASELENAKRQVKAKDLMLLKIKKTFSQMIEAKEKQLADLAGKNDLLQKSVASSPNAGQSQAIKELEKQNQNLNKQIEVYKNKITSLSTNMQPTKGDENFKDEARKLQMLNQQMKNQLDASKKEMEQLHSKLSQDNSQLITLRQDKAKLEAELKKANFESRQNQNVAQPNDQEVKRLQSQNQMLKTQLKDTTQKITVLENKLLEATKNAPKSATGGGDENAKVKLNQLEASYKKLNQDLAESRNQLTEAKKEVNKLRQDKTALQNQFDKLKKDSDKGKPAVPKKPGGKAA